MKANFSIKNNDYTEKKPNAKNNDDIISYEKYLKSITDGWN